MKRAAIYARVSTEHQTQTSIETQIKTCRQFCERQGWIVVDIFQEKDSGGKTERVEFQKMIAKALEGSYNVIVVEKFDRFFRDDIEDRRYTRMLESKNVLVVSALEGIDPTSASGKLLRWILSDINWFQREYMKEEQLRKTKEAALQGYWLGGCPPFGYKLVEVKDGERKRKKLEINEAEAEIVKKIFELYSEDYSVLSIAKYLNEHGLLRNGKPWAASSLYDIIRNPKYLGTYIWNRQRRQFDSNRQPVIAEGKIPAIITGPLAEAVREKLKQNQVRSPFHKYFWLLSGKLVCGICGQRLHACPHARYPTYRCDNDEHEYLAVRKDYAEKYVLEFIKLRLAEIDVEKLSEEYVNIYKTRAELQNAKRLELVQRLKEIEEAEQRVAEAIAKGISLDAIVQKAQELSAEKQTLIEKLKESDVPVPSREEIIQRLESFKQALVEDDFEIQKQAIFKLVKKIVVHPKNVLIVMLEE